MLNPEYSIIRDQPTSQASPLGINALLSRNVVTTVPSSTCLKVVETWFSSVELERR